MVQKALETSVNLTDIVNNGLIPAMAFIGEKYQAGEIYIPEMMIAARSMSETLLHFKNELMAKGEQKLGTVVIGTVKGDLHDIGKNLVAMMLEGQGFTVEDLGVSISTEKFIKAVKEKKADILAMSALLTTTMVEMQSTINALIEGGLKDSIKVVVGGAPITEAFATQIGADGYAYDSHGAAQKCRELLST